MAEEEYTIVLPKNESVEQGHSSITDQDALANLLAPPPSELSKRVQEEMERMKERPKKGLISSPYKPGTKIKEKNEPVRNFLSELEQKQKDRQIANERLGRTTYCLRETMNDDCYQKRKEAIERMKLLEEEDIAEGIDRTVQLAKKTIATPRKLGEGRKDPYKEKAKARYLETPLPPKTQPPRNFTPDLKFKSPFDNVKSKYLDVQKSEEKSPRQILEEKKESARKKNICEKPFRPSSYNAKKDEIALSPTKPGTPNTPRAPRSNLTSPNSMQSPRTPRTQTPRLSSPKSTPTKPPSHSKKTPKTTPRVIEFNDEEEQKKGEDVKETKVEVPLSPPPSLPIDLMPEVDENVIDHQQQLSEELSVSDIQPEQDLLTTEFSAEENQLLSKLELGEE